MTKSFRCVASHPDDAMGYPNLDRMNKFLKPKAGRFFLNCDQEKCGDTFPRKLIAAL